MRLTIEMSLDNAAFAEGGSAEIARAVGEALDKVLVIEPRSTAIRDINGNIVGYVVIEDN